MKNREVYNPAFVQELLKADKQPPENKFSDIEELIQYLNSEGLDDNASK
jgi:hypothetical protein